MYDFYNCTDMNIYTRDVFRHVYIAFHTQIEDK